MGEAPDAVLKWSKIFYYHREDYIEGTIFIVPQESTIITWVSDFTPECLDVKIPLDNLNYFIKKFINVGKKCSHITFVLKNMTQMGPFEFRAGGASAFIEKLRSYVDIHKDSSGKYFIKPLIKNPLPTYQLPISNNLNPLNLHTRIGSFASSLFKPPIDSPSSSQCFTPISPDSVHMTEENGFQIIEKRLDLPQLKTIPRGPTVTLDIWMKHLDKDGRVVNPKELKRLIFEGGIDPELRRHAWKYLLNYYKWENSNEENAKLRHEKSDEYNSIKTFWKTMTPYRISRFNNLADKKCLIQKDVFRTDRKTDYFSDDKSGHLTELYEILMTYTVYNLDIGYFQGMNDLLAILLRIMDNEVDAFWCFAGLIERIEGNFVNDMLGLRLQFEQLSKLLEYLMPKLASYLLTQDRNMPFFLKWLLIQFKREFDFDGIQLLWDMLWTDHLTENFHIFVAVGILSQYEDIIVREKMDANAILKLINDLSCRIDLNSTIDKSVSYFHQLNAIKDQLPECLKEILYERSHCFYDLKMFSENAYNLNVDSAKDWQLDTEDMMNARGVIIAKEKSVSSKQTDENSSNGQPTTTTTTAMTSRRQNSITINNRRYSGYAPSSSSPANSHVSTSPHQPSNSIPMRNLRFNS